MRPARTLAAAMVLALIGLAAPAARAEAITADGTAELAPTQVAVGRIEVDAMIDGWKQDAAEAGQDLRTYARSGLAQRLRAAPALPAIIDPQGVVRVLDGHHRIAAIQKVEARYGLRVPIPLDVVRDYRGQSFRGYAEHFVNTLRRGYFGADPPRSAVDRVRLLPGSFASLKNAPMRSVVGRVFEAHGIVDSWFGNYSEFYIGDRLLTDGEFRRVLDQRGLIDDRGALREGAAADAAVVALAAERIFGSPEIRQLMRRLARPEHRDRVRASSRRGRLQARSRHQRAQRVPAQRARRKILRSKRVLKHRAGRRPARVPGRPAARARSLRSVRGR